MALTETWDKAALAALLSPVPAGWPMPEGCSPECQYELTYEAPALRCTDLQPDQIDDGVNAIYRFAPRIFQDPPAAYLLAYDAESTSGGYKSSSYTCTLAYVPYLASNTEDGALINATGSVCTFYNATHVARTHCFNGTQESSVSVTDFRNPLNTTYRATGFTANLFTNSSQSGVLFSESSAFACDGGCARHASGGLSDYWAFCIFEPYNVKTLQATGNVNPGMNTTAAVINGNVSQADAMLSESVPSDRVRLRFGDETGRDPSIHGNPVFDIVPSTEKVHSFE
ncbi:hypothetical protein C8F04DRAFT_1396181 [Mycena alexandri]|uniref:Uncharacterized protein n=1 Tax=Mycena alexandri TaxID=1745969 RepID=A0AAD6ST13_9AGAR|nr:hypothetical protein C8F04DRAFT_1396181 [Mycena alexandri]